MNKIPAKKLLAKKFLAKKGLAKKVLVTGAAGFLGRSVVRSTLEQGYDVRALVRRDASTADWEEVDGPAVDRSTSHQEKLEIFVGDLRDRSAVERACAGIDAVIHLAACVSGTPQQQFQSTVAGTENLLSAMSAHNIRRLVLASSFYVYDWARARRSLIENSPLLTSPYHRDGYTISKWWQERICREWQQESDGQLTVLRPGYIWGHAHPVAPRIGFPFGSRFVVVGPFADAALTHVDNCGEYFARAVGAESIGATLNVVDGHRVSNSKMARRLAGTNESLVAPDLGRRIWMPYLCGAAISRMAAIVGRLVLGPKYRLPSLLMPSLFQARFRPLRFPNDRICDLLGAPRWEFEQCLERTLRNVREHRLDESASAPSTMKKSGCESPVPSDDGGPRSESSPMDPTEVGVS